MTYCIGIKSKQGVVALSDTRISSGLGISTSKKIYTCQEGKSSFFIMSSGLRSIRDKVIHYFQDSFEEHHADRLYKIANLLGEQVKKVRAEDQEQIKKSGFIFDGHFILGGQCGHDKEATVFLIFPEGNWVEVSDESPYAIIGNTGFGKPILRRLLTERINTDMALKAAYLSFDATYKNASDVDFPLDIVVYENDSFDLKETRKTENELKDISYSWNESLKNVAENLPNII